MALPLVTAAVALFYMGAIPLQIAVRWQSGVGFEIGIALFEPRFALRRTRKMHFSKPKKLPRNIDLSAALRTLNCLLRRIRFEGLRLTGDFGCADAAVTALICGGFNALGYALKTRTAKAHICLRPDFNTAALRGDLSGMISVRIGHIIFAALQGLIEYSSGRLNPWTSTPSKAL